MHPYGATTFGALIQHKQTRCLVRVHGPRSRLWATYGICSGQSKPRRRTEAARKDRLTDGFVTLPQVPNAEAASERHS